MTARERRLKWMYRRDLKQSVISKFGDCDGFYIVSDYGYEDCGYDGPFHFNELVKEWEQRRGHPLDLWNFNNHDGMHYVTNETFRLSRISSRQEGW